LRELALRAEALSGRSLGELAAALGVTLPGEQRRAKGIPGQLVERALGADSGSAPAPDFSGLGVELKTIPVGPDGRPRESTYVCKVAPLEIAHEEWPTSRVRRKLAHVLWVPLAAEGPLAARSFGRARLWQPSAEEEAELRADWEELAGLLGAGAVESVTAHLGKCLQVRPKAADGDERGPMPGGDDGLVETVPRGFYLRSSFTSRILKSGARSLEPGA
jgi:DNA mismatch repair protein MutH